MTWVAKFHLIRVAKLTIQSTFSKLYDNNNNNQYGYVFSLCHVYVNTHSIQQNRTISLLYSLTLFILLRTILGFLSLLKGCL